MDQFDDKTCLLLALPKNLQCSSCKDWADQNFFVRRARRSKCSKPWLFKEKTTAQKLRTAIKCWECFVQKGEISDYPHQVTEAATDMDHQLLPRNSPAAAATSSPPPTNKSTIATKFRKASIIPKTPNKTPQEVKHKDKRTRNQQQSTAATADPSWKAPGRQLFSAFNNLNLANNQCNFFCGTQLQPATDNDQQNDDTLEVKRLKKKIADLSQMLVSHVDRSSMLLSQNQELQMALRQEKEKVSNLMKQIDILNKNQVSNYHATVLKRDRTVQAKKAKQLDYLISILKKDKFSGQNNFARRLLGEIVGQHPTASFDSISKIICMARAQLLQEADLLGSAVSLHEVALSSPGEKTLRRCLDEAVGDALFSIHLKIFHSDKVDGAMPSVFLSCDKGTKGNFIKILSWFSSTSQKVEQTILDVDVSYGSSKECAEGM